MPTQTTQKNSGEKTRKAEWKRVRLGEICDINMGQSPESIYYNELGNGTPFFQGVTEFGLKYPEIRKYTTKITKLANAGDILFSVRAPVGDINYANIDCCIGRGLCAMKAKEQILDQKYLFYFLKNNFDLFQNNSNGSIYNSINKETLNNLSIEIPPLSEQKKIAEVLSAYDDLIEVNQKKIKILETLAQTLYKEWFVKPTKDGWPD